MKLCLLAVLAILSLIFILPGHGLAAGCNDHTSWNSGSQGCTLTDGTPVLVELSTTSQQSYQVINNNNSTVLDSGSQSDVQDWLNAHGATAGFSSNSNSTSTASSAQPESSNCSKNDFFFLPPWYNYLKLDPGTCTPQVSSLSDIYPIGLAVLEMLLRLAGFVAVISIIISGITYITATGSAEKAASARRRLYNSLIGLAIAFVAAGVVAFIGNSIT